MTRRRYRFVESPDGYEPVEVPRNWTAPDALDLAGVQTIEWGPSPIGAACIDVLRRSHAIQALQAQHFASMIGTGNQRNRADADAALLGRRRP